MGVTIQCNETRNSFDLTFGGFMRLRSQVARLSGEPFASHYNSLLNHKRILSGKDPFYEEFDRKTEAMVLNNQVPNAIADFCLQPDCEGIISCEACKRILEIIKDYRDNNNYGYGANPVRFSDFVSLLQECVERDCDFTWC